MGWEIVIQSLECIASNPLDTTVKLADLFGPGVMLNAPKLGCEMASRFFKVWLLR